MNGKTLMDIEGRKAHLVGSGIANLAAAAYLIKDGGFSGANISIYEVEDWAEIRRPHRAEGLPIKVIARVLGISKNTVKAALASDAPPKYQRAQRGSIVNEVEPRIRELLRAYPRMPATGWCSSSLRLPRDHYVRCDANDYSVHPAAIGHRVLARADHARVWATYQTLLIPLSGGSETVALQQGSILTVSGRMTPPTVSGSSIRVEWPYRLGVKPHDGVIRGEVCNPG